MKQINYKLYVKTEGLRPFLYGEYTCGQEVSRVKKEIQKVTPVPVEFTVYRKNGIGEWQEWYAV